MVAVTPAVERGRPDRVMLGLMALPVLAVLIVGITLAFQTRINHMPVMGVALFTGLLTLLPLVLDQGRPPSQRHIFLTLISLSWGIAYALPVFTYYLPYGGYTPSDNSTMRALHPRDLVRGQGVVLVAYLMLLLGYWLPLGRALGRLTPRPRRDWPPATGLMAAVILIPLGWFIYLSGQFGLLPARAGSACSECSRAARSSASRCSRCSTCACGARAARAFGILCPAGDRAGRRLQRSWGPG